MTINQNFMVKEDAKYRKSHPSPPSQNKTIRITDIIINVQELQDKKQKDK